MRPGSKPGTAGLSTVPGKANGVDVKVLHDTGCTAAVIRRDLVHEDQCTADTIGKAEIAMVHMLLDDWRVCASRTPCVKSLLETFWS